MQNQFGFATQQESPTSFPRPATALPSNLDDLTAFVGPIDFIQASNPFAPKGADLRQYSLTVLDFASDGKPNQVVMARCEITDKLSGKSCDVTLHHRVNGGFVIETPQYTKIADSYCVFIDGSMDLNWLAPASDPSPVTTLDSVTEIMKTRIRARAISSFSDTDLEMHTRIPKM